jgi:glutathione S-transferase
MKLYYSPGACSLSPHIALHEAGLPFQAVKAPTKTHKLDDGTDYYTINPLGYVPLLELDDGTRLAEGPAIVQYIADQVPAKKLAPAWGTVERYQLIDMLNYLSTELHKRIFYNVFNPNAAEPTKAAARALFEPTFDHLSKKLADRDTLVGTSFTVADAYLVTMLNWAVFLKVDLAKWPALAAYHQKHLKRPSVVQAMGVEMAERQRRAA